MASMTYISMLRGINVSGQKKIRMEVLRSMYQALGFANVRTYVQSGNVLFESSERSLENLTEKIQAQIEQEFGFLVYVFLRFPSDFQFLIDNNPFARESDQNPGRLMVTFFYQIPSKEHLDQLVIPDDSTDAYVLIKNALYLYCPDGYGRSKLSNNFFERKLKVPCTTRNWKTINSLNELAMS